MRRFSKSTVLFTCENIDMIGNCENGCLIGLSGTGRELCESYEDQLLDDASFSKQDPALFSALKDHGFLGSFEVVPLPMTAYIHVTQRCNLSCTGCYSRQDFVVPDPGLSAIQKMIEFLFAMGVTTMHISGGEPLLRNDIALIVDHARRMGFECVDVITNGTIYNAQTVSAIASNIDTVFVSLGSCSENDRDSIKGPNLYQRVIDNVNRMIDQGADVCLLPTIHAHNIEDIPRYVNLAKKLGVRINFSILSCSSCNKELGSYAFDEASLIRLASILITAIKQTGHPPALVAKRSCQAGIKQLSVTANGDVFPCHMLHSPAFKMGNALTGEWNDQPALSSENRSLLNYSVDNNRHCGSCEFGYLCGGGCRARAYSSKGSIDEIDSYCTLLSTFFRLSLQMLSS